MERDERLNYPYNAASRVLPEWRSIADEANRGSNLAITLLMDLEMALDSAGLTDRQRDLLYLHYYHGYTKVESAQLLGITKQSSGQTLDKAVNRVNDIYNKWGN